MITPVGVLTVEQIHQRKDDLLISVDDLKAVSAREWNYALIEFDRKLNEECDDKGMLHVVQVMQVKDKLIKSLDGGKR